MFGIQYKKQDIMNGISVFYNIIFIRHLSSFIYRVIVLKYINLSKRMEYDYFNFILFQS